ncbi:MAG TPA: hypothetical protein PK037_06900, partial [Saprospiraceae bacterium]|nr:hypothetical protein [Saprospiraceae bacterium]
KISPKPVMPPLHLYGGVGVTKMLGLWPNDRSVHLERCVKGRRKIMWRYKVSKNDMIELKIIQ